MSRAIAWETISNEGGHMEEQEQVPQEGGEEQPSEGGEGGDGGGEEAGGQV